jgi:hypothetical protein
MSSTRPAARLCKAAFPLVFALAIGLAPRRARSEPLALTARVGVTGGATTWADDPVVLGDAALGLRFAPWIGVEVLGRVGYGAIDERLLAMVGLGAAIAIPTGTAFSPTIRFAAIHQHETPVDVLHHDWFGHVVGVGDGIRHRFGGEAAFGVRARVLEDDGLAFHLGIEGLVDAFPDDRGPTLLAGGGLTLAAELDL